MFLYKSRGLVVIKKVCYRFQTRSCLWIKSNTLYCLFSLLFQLCALIIRTCLTLCLFQGNGFNVEKELFQSVNGSKYKLSCTVSMSGYESVTVYRFYFMNQPPYNGNCTLDVADIPGNVTWKVCTRRAYLLIVNDLSLFTIHWIDLTLFQGKKSPIIKISFFLIV